MKRLLPAILAAVIMTGCGSTSQLAESDLVQGYGIMKLTEQAVKGDAEKAARVQALALEIQKRATDEQFDSVDLLIEAVKQQIPFERLSAADTFFATEVLRLWREDLVNRYGGGVLPEDLRLSVKKVTGWVVLAAQP